MTTGVSTRLIDRRRRVSEARHRRRRTILLGTVAAAAVSCGAWWLATGPLLSVSRVSISGYRQSDQARVVRAVQAAAVAGDMLHLPTQRIRAALAGSPWVEDVAVHHNWPRGVDVRITQATPTVIAITGGGERLLVSDRGRVLGPQTVAIDLPEMRLPTATPGEWLTGAPRRGPVVLAGALSKDVRGRVRGLTVSGGVLTGRLDTGTELRFGQPIDLWRKGRSLDAVLASGKARKELDAAAYIDFSNPQRPVFGGLETEDHEDSTPGQTSESPEDQGSTTG